MNIQEARGLIRSSALNALRHLSCILPATINSFGNGPRKINSIVVINLDRQADRWTDISRELGRLRAGDGRRLIEITRRQTAVDARDGRMVAATSDVDPIYLLSDQLFVQPDRRLEASFSGSEKIRMTRQEVAVARSHIECWKAIAEGSDNHVLILEDDVWFRARSARIIDTGWQASLARSGPNGPTLLYLSYSDAGGSAERTESYDGIFRPARGLWFLSGYVLSREGAAKLLRSMPVVGPVDLWMNYRFSELDALAVAKPAILQRTDIPSANSYSILPYLARAGIVDSSAEAMKPKAANAGLLLAWSTNAAHDSLAMALSMLGLRVATFLHSDAEVDKKKLDKLSASFDAIVGASLAAEAFQSLLDDQNAHWLIEARSFLGSAANENLLPRTRTKVLRDDQATSWNEICSFLKLDPPAEEFPVGTPKSWSTFGPGPLLPSEAPEAAQRESALAIDESPWVLPQSASWQPRLVSSASHLEDNRAPIIASVSAGPPSFLDMVETFPGNLARFTKDGIKHSTEQTLLTVSSCPSETRVFQSGAFASTRPFTHGIFKAEIKPAKGAGLVTGFFLHRFAPRQEIDIEFLGGEVSSMVTNVFFNPGDEGASFAFGYRGTPYKIELGFDASKEFHSYSIEWRPDRITWSVDGKPVHERTSWDPTPIPYLPMKLYGNLWAPRSREFAGSITDTELPVTAAIRNISIWE